MFIGGAVFIWEYDTQKEKCNFWKMKKVWQPATLVSLKIQEHVLSFWKPPIKICLEPDCQVGSRILKVCQVMLKIWGLLNKLLYASDLKWAPLYIQFWSVTIVICFYFSQLSLLTWNWLKNTRGLITKDKIIISLALHKKI